jgi:mRNA interferase RelE/StbE
MYKIIILPEAYNDLKKIDKPIANRIIKKLKWLFQNMDVIIHESLKGELSSFLKLRVGDWRVIYEVDFDTKIIYVHKIGHRRDIYS